MVEKGFERPLLLLYGLKPTPDLLDLTNFVKIFKKQLIEGSIQPIELALTMRSTNLSFYKSFPKPPSVKQPIETINQQVVFYYLEKNFSFERT